MKLIGTDKPIHDARGKAAGFVKYAADIMLPNMAYVVVVHSTIPHGYVRQIHAEKALALPSTERASCTGCSTSQLLNRRKRPR